jgi:thiamine biosynthesis lipoprotein
VTAATTPNTSTRMRSMGCELVVAGATAAEREAVQRLFDRRERAFSRFRAGSELNRVNERAGRATLVSAEFAAMVGLALAAAEQTGGLVDPTLGRALEAAGYDSDFAALRDDPRPPGPPAPSSLAEVCLRGRILELPAGTRLDLNGVVKAKTVDDALALVRGAGYVSAGGDLACRGGLPVALPGGDTVRLVVGGLATSGSDRRRWRRGGSLQHHLIDPRTGRPAPSCWQQVTVCGHTCLAADIAAKAAFLLGRDGPDWLDQHRLPGRFRAADGRTHANQSWRQSLREHACI